MLGLEEENNEIGFGVGGRVALNKPKPPKEPKGSKNRKSRSRGRSRSKAASDEKRKKDKRVRRTKDHREDVMKRCKSCKKQKPHSEFYAAKAECRDCSHVQTNVLRQVRRQKETAWYDTLSEVEKENMNKAYVKVKKECEKDRTRVRFSVKKYKEELEARAGLRFEGRNRFMTKKQYISYARSEEGQASDFPHFLSFSVSAVLQSCNASSWLVL